MEAQKFIYCLESVADISETTTSIILPSLEKLAIHFGVANVYATCDSIEGFESSLSTLFYEDRNFNDYQIVYLVFNGENNAVEIDGYFYTLEEIAEFFEGKLTGKIIHFANTMRLELEADTAQFFLDVTGAKAISGYKNNAPILSSVIDNHFFALYQEQDDVVTLVEALYKKHATICDSMGFQLYY